MPSADQSTETARRPLTALWKLDARVGKWGYSVSGWAGVFIGAVSALLADDVAAALSLAETPLPETLAEPLVLLVMVYGLLGVAYQYRKRYGGPSCRV
ncbi:MAG: hypothetical protein ABEH83_06140 [Halobacterium sp.]